MQIETKSKPPSSEPPYDFQNSQYQSVDFCRLAELAYLKAMVMQGGGKPAPEDAVKEREEAAKAGGQTAGSPSSTKD